MGRILASSYIEELLAYNIEGMIVLNPMISSEELAACNIPIGGIEREDRQNLQHQHGQLSGRSPGGKPAPKKQLRYFNSCKFQSAGNHSRI